MTGREGIVLKLVHAGKSVVDETVVGLISADHEDDVAHRGVFGEMPVVTGDIRGRRGLPMRQGTRLDLFKALGVRLDGLFLEVANETVAELGRDQVGEEEEVVKQSLRQEDCQPEELSWASQLAVVRKSEAIQPNQQGQIKEDEKERKKKKTNTAVRR